MRFQRLLNAVLLGIVSQRSFAFGRHKCTTQDPIVHLGDDAVVLGTVDEKYPHVNQFLGIPYATPPTSTLRWRPPQPLRLTGNISAKAISASCMQTPPPSGSLLFTYDAPEFLVDGVNFTHPVISEDCLTLSVWAPRINDGRIKPRASKFPVLVFLPGGRFQTGGQHVPYTIPTQWVDRTQDLIVVTVKYVLEAETNRALINYIL
jgi:carboxylesterase type B